MKTPLIVAIRCGILAVFGGITRAAAQTAGWSPEGPTPQPAGQSSDQVVIQLRDGTLITGRSARLRLGQQVEIEQANGVIRVLSWTDIDVTGDPPREPAEPLRGPPRYSPRTGNVGPVTMILGSVFGMFGTLGLAVGIAGYLPEVPDKLAGGALGIGVALTALSGIFFFVGGTTIGTWPSATKPPALRLNGFALVPGAHGATGSVGFSF